MWLADQGAGFFVAHLSAAMSYSSTRSFFPPWLPPIMYSFPLAVAFQYSSSGAGTGAPFCINQRPGDCASDVTAATSTTVAVATTLRICLLFDTSAAKYTRDPRLKLCKRRMAAD